MDNHFPLESCKGIENMELIMLGTLGTQVFMKKKRQMPVYDNSQFDS
jgi:hypothetical protein